jgi:hypothetical protein
MTPFDKHCPADERRISTKALPQAVTEHQHRLA